MNEEETPHTSTSAAVTADHAELRLSADAAAHTVLDISFDGHRVWSAAVPPADGDWIRLAWPTPLAKRLAGRTRIEVSDPATGDTVAQGYVQFGAEDVPLALTDRRGRWLAMTKWGALAAVNEGRGDESRHHLVELTEVVVGVLEDLGFSPFLVGGALLGMHREGHLLSHDDDIDLAFVSQQEDPVALAAETYQLERDLVAAGLVVVRHSLAHLAIEFFDEFDRPDGYVDIFTGFFRGDVYHQPFALRGSGIGRSDLVPTVPIIVEGIALPEPAHPEAWLEFAYGPSWRTPDPSFSFPDDLAISSRFEGWFGSFNQGRDAWDAAFLEAGRVQQIDTEAHRAIERFLADVPAGASILDLGSGDGAIARLMAERGHRVVAVDYSLEANLLARSSAPAGVEVRYLNLNDRAAVLEFGVWMLGTGETWCVLAHRTLQATTRAGRAKALALLDLVLRGEGFADLVNDIDIAADFEPMRPDDWHLPTEWLQEEAQQRMLSFETIAHGERQDGAQIRRNVTVRARSTRHAQPDHQMSDSRIAGNPGGVDFEEQQ